MADSCPFCRLRGIAQEPGVTIRKLEERLAKVTRERDEAREALAKADHVTDSTPP